MRPGRYYLNKKGNVPELSPEDEKILITILLFLLLGVGLFACIILT